MLSTLIEKLTIFSTVYGIMAGRYILFSGIAFLVVWKLLGKKLEHRLIQKKRPEKKKIYYEFKYSMITFLIFGLTGLCVAELKKAGFTFIYTDLSEYGTAYFLFSIVAAILIHDTYFYWTHRLMHHPKLFKKMHLVHHRSVNPSPWASFSFHPYEAVVEAGIVPLLVLIMPMHPLAIFIFLIFMTTLNVIGHLGYELYPAGFTRNRLTGLNNTTTHHNMHHKYFNCNYGLYFNWWDQIMNTNHERYHETYDEIHERKKAGNGKKPVIEEAPAYLPQQSVTQAKQQAVS